MKYFVLKAHTLLKVYCASSVVATPDICYSAKSYILNNRGENVQGFGRKAQWKETTWKTKA
jgi:hypothetical protein